MRLQGRSLCIGPLTFTITRRGPKKDYGSIDLRQQRIYIAPNLQDDIAAVTILHEAIHGILYLGQYNDESDNEHLVDCLAAGIVDLLRRNEWLRQII